jgi:hypothetical protein
MASVNTPSHDTIPLSCTFLIICDCYLDGVIHLREEMTDGTQTAGKERPGTGAAGNGTVWRETRVDTGSRIGARVTAVGRGVGSQLRDPTHRVTTAMNPGASGPDWTSRRTAGDNPRRLLLGMRRRQVHGASPPPIGRRRRTGQAIPARLPPAAAGLPPR